jgi:2'-5' RNA ligase
MRTFIAVPLPPEVRALLGEMQKTLRSFSANVKWTAIPSIHLTLKFLGEIEPASLPRLVELLRAAAASEHPFSLHLHGLGGFPNLHSPRVIWCGLDGELPSLESLQKKVETACVDAGFAPEDRPFHPHLTLGRVRDRTNLQPLLDYIKIGSALEHTFAVREFNIYQSILRPQGALYSVLERIELQGD